MNAPLSRALACLLVLSTCLLPAETVKDREGAGRGDKAKLENDERWIYSDDRAALAKGKETGKPVMVTLRCVPCLACAGFDAEVLRDNTELTPLLDRFICVRVINANDLDLSMFQFDYDLSFSALFFNGDGTLCGRFGSWTHQEDSGNKATQSMKEAVSIADFSWVLHRSGKTASLPAEERRGGKEGTLQLTLTAGWREHPDHTKRVGIWPMRMMALGGLKLGDLAKDARSRLRIALEAVHVGQYNQHAATKRAGFRKGDVHIQVNGASNCMTETQLIASLLRSRKKGEKVDVTVLRNGKELKLPMQ